MKFRIVFVVVAFLIAGASCEETTVKPNETYWRCNKPDIRSKMNIIAFEPLQYIFHSSANNNTEFLNKYIEQCTCAVAVSEGKDTNLMVNSRTKDNVTDLALRCYLREGKDDDGRYELDQKRILVASYFTDLPQYAFSIEPHWTGGSRERCYDPTGRPTRNLFHLLTCFVLNIAFGERSNFIFAGPLLMNSLPLIPYEKEVDEIIWPKLKTSCEARVAVPRNNTFDYKRDPEGDKCVVLFNITASGALTQYLSMCCCTNDLEKCNYKKHRAILDKAQNKTVHRIQCAIAFGYLDDEAPLEVQEVDPKVFYKNNFQEWCSATLVWDSDKEFNLMLGDNGALCHENVEQDLCPGHLVKMTKEIKFESCCNTNDFCNYFELIDMIAMARIITDLKCPYGNPRKANATQKQCFFYFDYILAKLVNIDESFLDFGVLKPLHDNIPSGTCKAVMARLTKIDPTTCDNATKVYAPENLHELRRFKVCTCDARVDNCLFSKDGEINYHKSVNVYNCEEFDETIKAGELDIKNWSKVERKTERGPIGCYFRVQFDRVNFKISAGRFWPKYAERCLNEMDKEYMTDTELFYCHTSDSSAANYKERLGRFLGKVVPKIEEHKPDVNVCSHRDFHGHAKTPDECISKSSRCYSVRFANSTFTTGCDAGCTSNIDNHHPTEPELHIFGNYRAICDAMEFPHETCHVSYPSAPEDPRIVCCTDSGKAVLNVEEMKELNFGLPVKVFADSKKSTHLP